MTRSIVLTVLVALVAAGLAVSGDEVAQVADLRGEWCLVATQDENHTDPGSEQIKMVVRADGRVVFRIGDVETNEGTFTVNVSGKTRCADLKLADGKTVRGIYERKGDELIFCFDEASKTRPVTTRPSGSQWMERWERVKH